MTWLGRPAFLAGINDFLTRHRFGSATLADLLDSLARASELDVHGWAGQWLRSTGVDTLTAAITPGATPAAPAVHVDHLGTRPHRLAVGIYDHSPGEPGRLDRRAAVVVSIGAGARRTAVPLPPGPPPALVLLNEGDLSYCKVRFDPRSWATVTSSLSGIADPLARAVVWNAARDLVRDGELPAARDYLQLVARHLPAETDTAIVGWVLSFARGQVADRYLAPQWRGEALRLIAGTCLGLLDRAADGAGSGLRLAAARGLIDSASGPAQIAMLRAGLAGEPLPGGLDLAADLRWQALLRLTVLGAAGPPEIDSEGARDATTTGRQWAARCRAAIAEPGAKRAAWAAMFETGAAAASELSGYLLSATAQGFWHPEQAALLAGYLPRYFPAVLATARCDAARARELARHGFPGHAVDAGTLLAGEQCLPDGAAAAGLRRLLADQLDDLRRALRVRAG